MWRNKRIRCNPFTELHRALHKNILIWRQQKRDAFYEFKNLRLTEEVLDDLLSAGTAEASDKTETDR